MVFINVGKIGYQRLQSVNLTDEISRELAWSDAVAREIRYHVLCYHWHCIHGKNKCFKHPGAKLFVANIKFILYGCPFVLASKLQHPFSVVKRTYNLGPLPNPLNQFLGILHCVYRSIRLFSSIPCFCITQ